MPVNKTANNYEISRVELDDRAADYSVENGFLKLKLGAPTGQTVSVNIVSGESSAIQVAEESLGTKARVAVRRYLCDFRDNYLSLSKSETLLKYSRRVVKSR